MDKLKQKKLNELKHFTIFFVCVLVFELLMGLTF